MYQLVLRVAKRFLSLSPDPDRQVQGYHGALAAVTISSYSGSLSDSHISGFS